jgi:hypothetical protein
MMIRNTGCTVDAVPDLSLLLDGIGTYSTVKQSKLGGLG